MTFLNPLVLFGLIAAAIPLIIHLLNLRKLRTIEFSTLTFLKELQQTKIRRLKLRQLLLLIIRTLIVIFIILAFSRPTLKGTLLGTVGTHAHSSVVIIMDDSFSMSVQDEQGELFKQARESALSILELLKEGDEAFLIKLSNIESEEIVPRFDFEMLKMAIMESKVSLVRNSAENALRLAARIINQSKNANREIYFISDFQKTMMTVGERYILSSAKYFSDDVKFYFVHIGNRELNNLGLDSVKIETQILEKNKPIIIKSVVKNFSDTEKKDFVLSLLFDGIRVAQKSFDIAAWGTSSIELTASPKRTGMVGGYIQLENDILEIDNRRFFTLNIPDKIKLGLVSDTKEEVKFIKLALSAGGYENSGSSISMTDIHTNSLSSVDLKNYDVILLSSRKELSNFEITKLKLYVELGGGLIIFPNNEIIDQINLLFSNLEIPEAERLNKTSQSEGISFQKIDLDHPIFSGVFEDKKQRLKSEIESPKIYISLKRQTGKKGRSIIILGDGSPFLSEYQMGSGRILVYASAANLNWTDFPLKGIFAPLIYRSIVYAGLSHEKTESFITGQDADIKMKTILTGQPKWKLIYPDMTEELITTVSDKSTSENPQTKIFDPATGTLKLGKQNQQGIYKINDGDNAVKMFSVNIDSRESDLRKINDEQLKTFLSYLGIDSKMVVHLDIRNKIQEKILESRLGVELWKYAIVFVLLLALFEMLIARDKKGQTEK